MVKLLLIGMVLFSSVVFLSCNPEVKYSGEERDSLPVVTIDIPPSILKAPSDVSIAWFKKTIGLPELSNGYRNLQVRIWQDYLDSYGQVIVITDSVNYWSALLINYWVSRDSFRKLKAVFFEKVKLGTPKSGWPSFVEKLNRSDFKVMEDSLARPSGHDTEAVIVSSEIADGKTYRFNDYSDPSFVHSHTPAAVAVLKLIALVNEEFSLKPHKIVVPDL
jgi:hypothetical protein